MSVIDVDSLLKAITADAPCGEDLEYDPAFAEMDRLAQETPERQYGDTIIPAEPPDWRSVGKIALELSERTHDLRVAVSLSRALLQTDGLPGFADGLALVGGLITHDWDDVYPQLDPDDDNDPILRVNTLVALCDAETTLRDLRETPLVSSRALGSFNLRDIQIVAGVFTPVSSDESEEELPTQTSIDGAFQDAASEDVQATAAAVEQSIAQVERIEAEITDRVGVSQAPDMSALTAMLKEIRQALATQLQRLGASVDTDVALATAEAADGTDIPASGTVIAQQRIAGEITSREDVIRTLDKICEYFERNEPSSPVPFLLKRAKNLVNKDFIELLNDLTPSGIEQANLIFGLEADDGYS